MSGDAPPPAKRRTSGDHPAVVGLRKKIDSMTDKQLPQLCALNERIRKIKARSDPPKDERRENENEPQISDVVSPQDGGEPVERWSVDDPKRKR